MSALPAETGEFIFNHIVFPPKLPQQEDGASSAMAGNQELLKLVSDEAVGFAEALNQSNVVSDCQKIVHMLESLQKIEAETDSVEQILSNEFEDLSENGM